LFRIDRYERLAVDLYAAKHECEFYNGKLPTIEQISMLFSLGILRSTAEIWTDTVILNDATGTVNYATAIIPDNSTSWSWLESPNSFLNGKFALPTVPKKFRCFFTYYMS